MADLQGGGGAGKDPLATALSEAASWQARAERLEGVVEYAATYLEASLDTYRHRSGNVSVIEPRGVERILRQHREALSSPRPEPSKLLEVVRAAVGLAGVAFNSEGQSSGHECFEEMAALADAVDALTPEERAAILGNQSPAEPRESP